MIRRLRVRGYKSLVDAEVEFERITVLVGPNGAGKSNLLDLIGLLSRLAARESVREAFAGHRGRVIEAFHSALGFGAQGYAAFEARRSVAFKVECDLQLNPTIVHDINEALASREKEAKAKVPYTRVAEQLLRYTIVLEARPATGDVYITEERLEALGRDGEPRPARKPFLEQQPDAAGRPRFTARIERQGHPRYFDAPRTRTLLSELSDIVYHPHVVAAAREISSWRVYYVEADAMRQPIGLQTSAEPGRRGELLPAFLFGLQQKHPATFRNLVDNLKDLVSGLEGLEVRTTSDGLLEIVATTVGGAEMPAQLLSEGTLRLICLLGLSIAPTPTSVIAYEEPENGVNPARLDIIAQILENAARRRREATQFILTTHSPLVCERLPGHILLCAWTPSAGSSFTPLGLRRDTLFFERELRQALDAAERGGEVAAVPRGSTGG